jgi:hypothetical protein
MNLAARLRARRVESRNRRILNHAIESAATPAMRHELITMAQQQVPYLR